MGASAGPSRTSLPGGRGEKGEVGVGRARAVDGKAMVGSGGGGLRTSD